MSGATTLPQADDARSTRDPGSASLALAIAWSAADPRRAGEVALVPPDGRPHVLGRGDDADLRFHRQRPGASEPAPPLAEPGLSRKQLVLVGTGDGIEVEHVGRCEMRVNGTPCDRATVCAGDVLHLDRQLVLFVVRRADTIPLMRHFPREAWRGFGEPDAFGILGESPLLWRLRERLAFVAKSGTHTLLVGESGSGKELAARALHQLSRRASRSFVARNAATLPPGLIDAELFGNVRNYPNPGMPERAGLVGEADGGTLFLDEIGELPEAMQAHLLRVLDAGGEYQRLGDAGTRRSSFCLVGATNRDVLAIKHDILARLTSGVQLTPLHERREDVPLLARYLLLRAAEKSPELAERFVVREPQGRPYARFEPRLVEHLLRRAYAGNVRELDAVLWRAMSESTEDVLVLPESDAAAATVALQARPSPSEPPLEAIQRALADAKGSVTRAARALGLSSRYSLYRLMKKHAIDGGEGEET